MEASIINNPMVLYSTYLELQSAYQNATFTQNTRGVWAMIVEHFGGPGIVIIPDKSNRRQNDIGNYLGLFVMQISCLLPVP